VNELLTNMERLAGMLICATNFQKLLDSAAIRRFNFKLEFDFLRPEGTLRFYSLFFGALLSSLMSAEETAELQSMSALTPGDFKVVHQQHAYFEGKDLTHRMLIDALQSEMAAKGVALGKRMGF
jgi:AAA+ superfamily predicted ATPase